MVPKLLCSFVAAVCLSGNLFAATLITGFGSSETNPFHTSTDFLAPWTGSQTTTSVSVINVSNETGGIYSLLDTPISISGDTAFLLLTGQAATPPTPTVNNFQITLYDSSLNSLSYNFSWADFAGGSPTTNSGVLVSSSGVFNGTVASWGLSLFGLGDSVSFTFDQIEASAVPEPATMALLVITGTVLVTFCRRRRVS